jgi:metal-dependent amidase/aminoacylase/carboxypeptidase family protein
MSGRKRPSDDIGVPADFLRTLLHSLEEELPRALDLRERLHMIPEPSHGEHATIVSSRKPLELGVWSPSPVRASWRASDPQGRHACSAENVIPGVAEAGGTLRALDPEDREPLRRMAREIVENTARAHGCTARVEVIEGEPATVNDPALADTRTRCSPKPISSRR